MVNQLVFRDTLREDATLAKAYEALKIASASKFRNDRGGYLLSKNEFILQVLSSMSAEGRN